MKALIYEVKAYRNGQYDPELFHCGKGKRGRGKAEAVARGLFATGEYEAVFVDAYNDEEIVDDACLSFCKK